MITIYELKRRNIASGGKFFDAGCMKSSRQTLKNFSVRATNDPAVAQVIYRPDNRVYHFNLLTGRYVARA